MSSGHKDLSDLRNLPRSPIGSYLQKQARPKAPRPKPATFEVQTKRFTTIGSYSPSHLWSFISEYVRNRLGRRHPFQTYSAGQGSAGVYKMPSEGEVRIALAGDWATGTDEAAKIGDLISSFAPHYTIHLGDVYYVGDSPEVDENFLGIQNPQSNFTPCRWPNGSLGSFALNGNHEMYSLGTAYFDKMLKALGRIVEGRAEGQLASFFCLENDHWRILAVDTGYNSIGWPGIEYLWPPDSALPDALIDWIRNAVRPDPNDPRGIVVLSHHQYFSCYEPWYPKPAKQLSEFFQRPVLWFWGHEHRMAIYEKFAVEGGVAAFGRCIGHGGMPIEFPPESPPHPECKVDFVDKRPYANDENLNIAYNGFARLYFQLEKMTAEYVDVHGTLVYSETWAVKNGELARLQAPAAI
jgi:hypothetical protein